MPALKQHTFVCLDLETTGLDAKKDRIIEIAAAKFTLDDIVDQYETLIDPKMEIPAPSIAVHHITQEMVNGKPIIEDEIHKLLNFIGDLPLVGHSISFDIDIIHAQATRLDIATNIKKNPNFDTLRLARLYGQSPTNSLEMLRQHFNIAAEGAHRAMSDVIVNIQVFKFLSAAYKTLEEIHAILAKPIQMKHMPLGKHKGRLVKELPLQYLFWAAKQDFDQDLLFTLRSEINRRKKGSSFCQAGNPFMKL